MVKQLVLASLLYAWRYQCAIEGYPYVRLRPHPVKGNRQGQQPGQHIVARKSQLAILIEAASIRPRSFVFAFDVQHAAAVLAMHRVELMPKEPAVRAAELDLIGTEDCLDQSKKEPDPSKHNQNGQ
jgi:hypothetical protein